MKRRLIFTLFILILISYIDNANALKCSDSDGGQSFFNSGTVTDSSGGKEFKYNDFCGDPDGVYEGYCVGDSYNTVYKSCSSLGKFVCSNGVCIAGTPIMYECSEDDGGLNIGIKGSTQYKWANASGSGSGTRTDICLNSKQLNEAYCRNNRGDVSVIDCGQGLTCYDGKCVKSTGALTTKTCVDDDKGLIKEVKGTTTLIWNNASGSGNLVSKDFCSNLNEVNEYYCSGNEVAYQKLKCLNGEICSNGVCVSPEKNKLCGDSDGDDKNILGNTYGKAPNDEFITFYDHCIGISQVREYVCDSDGIVVRGVDEYCDPGYSCSYGSCVLSGLVGTGEAFTCLETDYGEKVLTKGKTFVLDGNGKIYSTSEDYCMNALVINESFCGAVKVKNFPEQLLKSSIKDCRDYGKDFRCNDGACKLSCEDGTVAGQCSLNKPSYCKENFDISGKISKGTALLSNNCQICGCPANTPTCLSDGRCGGYAVVGGISGKVVFNNPINLAALWLLIIMLLISALYYFSKKK